MIAKLTVYKGYLVIETLKPKKTKDFVPIGPGRIGCVLINTAKNLGASKEAMAWLKRVPTCHDDLGDIDAFTTTAGQHVFSWLGGLHRVIEKPEEIVGSRTYRPDFPHVTIPNDTSEEAKKAIDNA